MKRILSAVLLLAILLSLAACGGTTNDPGTTDTPGGSEVVTQNPEQTGTASGKTDAPSGGKLPSSGKTEESVETGPVPLQVLLGNHYEGEWSEDFTPLCSVEWDSIILGEESATAFPELAQNLWEMTEIDFEYNAGIMADMLPGAREAALDREYFNGFTSNSEYFVQRADDRILSVRVDGDTYTGGVHPNYGVVGMNLDPVTGEPMELSDVLTDLEELPTILTEKIRSKYTFEPFSDLQEQLEGYEDGHYSWTLDYQGITFYFSPYEIAPYAAGLLTATIWYDELPELFVEKYIDVPIPIVQAVTGTDQIGRFDIMVDTDTNSIDSYTWQLVPIDDSHCPRDLALEELIHKYNSATEEKYSRYITRFAGTYTHPARNQETQLGRLFADLFRDNLGLDVMLLASGSLRIPEMGPIVTLRELTQMYSFHDEIFRITVTGAQLKGMISHLFRPGALEDDHSEFYQFSGGIRVVVSRGEQRVTELSFEGAPIADDKLFRVGLQGYHYKNMKDFFGISEEEAASIVPSKVLSTNAMDVLEENLSRMELVACPEDERWIMVP